jgi:hypothetical protein
VDSKIEAYPLQWPAGRPRRPPQERTRARFSSYGQAVSVYAGIERVRQELGTLGVDDLDNDVVVSSNIPTRLDGLPLSKTREPADPAVAVYFRLKRELHCLSCDRWDRVADNLAAIANHVHAMRGQFRWGVADVRTAFAGFKALPAVRPWWVVLGFSAPIKQVDDIRNRVRQLALFHHPDRGGDPGKMQEITEAAALGMQEATR